ncbi:MAG TPA: DMT family transporter [Mycobacteriales bacterium]|nr:DMT family transporter [Mycobacteriales bacterium]
MLAVFYAVCAAAANAVGAVLQRRAARTVPLADAMRFKLIIDLIRRPIWLGGVAALIAGFLFQAAALSVGDLALVQPIVVAELPLTLVVAAVAFRTSLDRDAWIGAIAVSGGLAVLLIATAPQDGTPRSGLAAWVWACVASVGAGAVLVAAGLRTSGGRRAALYGAAAGLGFGFTAALMKGALNHLASGGVERVVTSWQLYLMVVTGVASFFLVQNALQSGSLVAAQPPISACDPLVSVGYGVLLFGEQLRTGVWLAPALVGGIIIVLGSIALSRSPLATGAADDGDPSIVDVSQFQGGSAAR